MNDPGVSDNSRDVGISQRESHLLQIVAHAERIKAMGVDGKRSGENVDNGEDKTESENTNHTSSLMTESKPALSFADLARSSPGDLSLIDSAVEIYKQFENSGNVDDLYTAIALTREGIVELSECSDDYVAAVNTLANALSARFEQEGDRGDLDAAILLHRQALELFPPLHPNRSSSLNNLANALWTLFEQGGQQDDLDEAILLHRQALELRAPPHPLRSSSLSNLANVLSTRYEQGGPQGDLDEAISLYRESLELRAPAHPDRSMSLNNLASGLSARFQRGGEQGDLDEAIFLHRQAIELRAPPHPLRSTSLNNLANVLWTRFEKGGQGGQQGDLDEVISLHRESLELRALPHPDRSLSLNNLAAALSTRFEQGGQRGDLDEAILFNRQALELFSQAHPLRSGSLNNLAYTLWTRFQEEGRQGDLEEAILLHRQAVKLFPPPHPNRSSSLSNLANVLWTRFQRGGQQRDLDEAISLHRQALELRVTPHPDRSSSLNDLANTLSTKFKKAGQPGDLYEAISLHREALHLRAPPHPSRSTSLNNLANALSTRFEQGGERGDLDEAISLHRQALELRAPPHPLRSNSYNNLAKLLMSAHSLTKNESDYLAEAISSFSAAMKCLSQSPSRHFHIAKEWAYYADLHRHPSAIEAYDAALSILPQLAALGLDIRARHEALTDSEGLARRAARCAIQEGRLDKAVEYLDTGRAIFWSQLINLRSPVDQLHDLAPELADRLRNIASALERGSHRETLADTLDNQKKMTLEEEASRLTRINKDWLTAIDEVRDLDGFEDFLRPSRFSSLQAAAAKCPVIVLVSNDDGSHCLIVRVEGVHCIALPNLHLAHLRNLVYLIQAAASQSQIWRSSTEESSQNRGALSAAIKETLRNWANEEEKRGMRYKGQIPSDDIFKSVLKTLWDEVVKPIVNFFSLQKSENPPVLQWCPTGLFSFLPVHAAGCYDNKLDVEYASDYIVSSYIPTIGALLTHNLTPSTKPFKMMVVVRPQELPSTKTELAKIEQYVSKESLIKLGIPGATASIEAVTSHLSDVSIAHFACHGKQDRSKPLESGLKLEDGMLLISRIIKEPMLNGSLAFLSACETAMGDKNLPDEAMSLAASLFFSGFRHVVATMWEMRDEDGPTIADYFYKELFRGPDGKLTQEPDTGRSAQALHHAVKELRSKNVPFRSWVPFILMDVANSYAHVYVPPF